MQERRAYQRFFLDGSVVIKTAEQPNKPLMAYLDDVSFGGFSIYSKESPEANSNIEFNIMTNLSEQAISGKGRVCYKAKPQDFNQKISFLGIEFTEVNKDMVSFLINRIQARVINKLRQAKQVKPVDYIPY